MGMNQIIIVGAGYAGLLAANRLAVGLNMRQHRITVVNDRPDFVEQIRLHELLAGSRDVVTIPLAKMLRPGVELVVDRAIGLSANRVALASGRELAADHIVLAFGSGAAGGVTTLEGAAALHGELTSLPPRSHVRVLGAGLTGIELADEIAEQRPQLCVHLVDPAGLAPRTTSAHRAKLERSLRRLGVEVSGRVVEDARVPGRSEDQADSSQRPDLVLDCTGFRVPPLARDSGLAVDEDGRVLVDRTLAVPGHPGLWAAGDCANVRGMPHLRMSCAAAEPLGGHVADAILASIRGVAPPALDLGFAAQCLSMGRRDGLVIPVRPDDSPRAWSLSGRLAALAKEAICRGTVLAPVRAPMLYRWPKGPQ